MGGYWCSPIEVIKTQYLFEGDMPAPNVLLVVLDSVRARNTSIHGYHRETTPFLSEYATGATVYEQARAPGIHSVASHASLWTGSHVEEHQVTEHEARVLPDSTVWRDLAERGYRTGIFTTNPVVAHSSNLANVFDTAYTDDPATESTKPFPDAHSPDDVVTHEGVLGNLRRCLQDDDSLKALVNSATHFKNKASGQFQSSLSSPEIVDEFLSWQGRSDGPWAACINLMDTHFPYEPDADHNLWGDERLLALHDEMDKPPANEFIGGRPWWQLEAFESLYDGTIRAADAHVKRIVRGLRTAGVHEDTLVVVTSDHGEGFGEVSRLTNRMKLVDHSWGIHEALTHVPLVVKYPSQTEGHAVKDPVSLTGFPDAVEAALDGTAGPESFNSEGPVVASTHRLLSKDDGIFEGSDERADDYRGPWRAVYRHSGDTIVKNAARENESVTVEITDAQESRLVSRNGATEVEAAFDKLEHDETLSDDVEEIGADIQRRLTDLGYIR